MSKYSFSRSTSLYSLGGIFKNPVVTPEGAAELATEMATFHGATPTQVRAVMDVAYRLVQKAIMGDNMKATVTEFSLTEDNGPGRSIRVNMKACDAVKWEQDPEKAFLWSYSVQLWVTRRGKLYTYDDGEVTGPDAFHAGLYYWGKGLYTPADGHTDAKK